MVKICKVLVVLLFLLTPLTLKAASLYIEPSSGSYEVGDRVTIKIKVRADSSINAVSSSVLFPTSNFSIESLIKTGSVLDFWVTEPSFSKGSGLVNMEGVALNGASPGEYTVLTVILKAMTAGSVNVNFKSGQILANDGQGTDILKDLLPSTFTIKEQIQKPKNIIQPVIKEVTEPVKVAEQPKVEEVKLKGPQIFYANKYGNPAILGTSDYKNSQVLVTFVSEFGGKVFVLGDTDSFGEFALVVPASLKTGKYKVTAIIINDKKESSEVSNEITIKVGNIFSDMTNEVKIAFGLLILAIIYLFVRIYFHLNKDKNIHYFLRRKVDNTENVLHKSFSLLKDDLSDSSKAKIKKDLDSVEELMEKKIKDIESL